MTTTNTIVLREPGGKAVEPRAGRTYEVMNHHVVIHATSRQSTWGPRHIDRMTTELTVVPMDDDDD